MKPAAWQVDPAWPSALDCDEDDDDWFLYLCVQDKPPDARDAVRDRIAALHLEHTRTKLLLHHARRLLGTRPPAPAPRPPPQPPTLSLIASPAPHEPAQQHPRRRHYHVARNDRLLAIFETTSENLPRLERCRRTAKLYAAEVAAAAGLAPEHARVLPATTARDAIAEALERRLHVEPSDGQL